MCSNLIVMSTFAHNFYAVFCLSVIVTAYSKDVCTELDEHKISSQLHAGATPVGRAAAGTYVRDNNAHTLSDCILGCCESDGSHSSLPCNVAFFSNLTCYHIACNTSHPELCNYEERDGKKFKDTYYMTIRPIFTTSIKSDDENDVDSEDNYENQYESLGEYLNQLTSGEVSRDEDPVPGGVGECEPGGGDCGDMEMCHFEMSEVYLGYTCRCVRGFERNEDTGECDEAIRPASRMCTYGIIDDCFIHEECILRNSRARHGLCECEEDFERNQNTGWCELQQKFDSPSSSIQQTTVFVEKVVDETTAAPVIATSDITTTTTTAPVIKMPTSTVAPTVETIVVSAGENKIVQLPDQTTTIAAFAIPQDDTDSYHYEWTLLTHPDSEDDQVGQMQDMNTPNLKLSGLIAGLYTFKVAVSGDNKFGESYVNVTVLNPARDNAAPCAIINPPSQQVNQPNDVVLDGSESTDDEGISLYLWEMVSKPLNTPHIVETDANKQILVLKNLAPGNYKFKLSVTDTDGLVNSTFSNVTVIREIDYPPMANAGSNVILNLPQNSITLNGNASTDDHGIESYEWMKVNDDRLTADMTGTRTPYLHLENLEVGDYTFTLKVTDSSGQTNSADVLVMVKAEHNRAPVPVAGENRVVFLPTDTISLDGSNSTDDKLIDTYKWSQVSGPPVTIDNSDRAIATISHPTVGDYSFRLMVTDNEGLQASTTVDIQIKPNDNQPPVAIAGGDRVVRLPISIVTLDGSRSTDDRGVTSYLWTRDDRSLAAGDILNNTDRTAHLQLINLVAGRYIFTLTVGDNEGLQGTDSVTLLIKPDERSQDQIEIYLDTDLGTFTEAHKKQLQTQLAMLYHSADKADVEVVIQRLDPLYDTGQVRATFYVITRDSDGSASETEQANSHVEKGTEVVSTLKRKLETDAEMLDFKVIQLDTLVCQNNCSGHGHCDMHTKECICEAFWMQNPVRVYVIGDGSYNCEWSVLYVIIIAFILVIVFGILVWMSYCCCERCCRIRPKKRHRYSLLEDDDDNEHQRNELMPKVSKMQSSSLMKSESEFSTDEETLFISAKKQQTNGHVKNGFKHKNRVKT